MVTQTEDDTNSSEISPLIRIDYYARINNDLVTDAGDTLQNGVVLNYLNGETAETEVITAEAAELTVSEPELTLSKTLANVTTGKDPADTATLGDVLEYRVAAINTGSTNSTAFDVNILDNLPVGLVLDASFTPTAAIDGVDVADFVALPTVAPTGTLIWGRDNGDSSLDIPAGQVLVLTYRVIVQVIPDPAELIENEVWSDWTSLQESENPYERTGAGSRPSSPRMITVPARPTQPLPASCRKWCSANQSSTRPLATIRASLPAPAIFCCIGCRSPISVRSQARSL